MVEYSNKGKHLAIIKTSDKVHININTQHSHNMHGSLVYTLLHIHGSYIVVISLAIG